MPQMKPMMWTLLMMTTLTVIMLTMIMNFFTISINKMLSNKKKIMQMKWKW